MEAKNIRSIVAATDLTPEADRVLRAAAAIAALTGAELHVIHVRVVPERPHAPAVEDPAPDREAEAAARRELEAQLRRATPAGFEAAKLVVVTGISAAHSIRKRAHELAADLIVLGPHRDSPGDRPYLGTTADRLIRTAGVPCLIIRESLDFPVRRIGVLTDFSPAARAAQETAGAWMAGFSGGGAAREPERPRISLAHLAWLPEGGNRDAIEKESIRPRLRRQLEHPAAAAAGGVEIVPEVLWAGDAVDTVREWVRDQHLAMVVVGTQGKSRLPYAYLGSLASTVARTAPCSVLLVPPEFRASAEGEVRVRRVVTGVDFHESSWEAALWVMRHLAPDAQHELLHVIDLPDLPAPLEALRGNREELGVSARNSARRRLDELSDLGVCPSVETHIRDGRPSAEIVRLAEETQADLVVVGEQGTTRGLAALLGSTAERVLFDSRIPVLLARKVGDSPPRRLLVAIDPSEVSDQVLAWTRALLERFDATVTVLNVVDRVLLVDELTGLPTARTFERVKGEAIAAMQGWLEEVISASGLAEHRVEAKVVVGDPSYEIISEAARKPASDLVLLGSKGGDIARTPLIGRIVNKVVRSAPCSVLVVPYRGRARGATIQN